MRFVLVGDDFPAVQTLKLLVGVRGPRVCALFSSPRQRVGSLNAMAQLAGIPTYSSEDLRGPQACARLQSLSPDWLVNVNSTVVLSDALLRIPRRGALNMHPGLLPEYAGLHTHQWAIRNGEDTFGVTIHHMEPSLDTGDIVLQRRFPVASDETGLSLYRRCIQEGAVAMQDVLRLVVAGEPLPRRRQDLSKYRLYRHRDALDGRIEWRGSAVQVERFVRAGNYTMLTSPTYTPHLDVPSPGNGPLIEVLKVAVTDLAWPARAGMVLETPDAEPPVVTCGDGRGVRLVRTRIAGEPHVLDVAALKRYLPPGLTLRGRRPAPGIRSEHCADIPVGQYPDAVIPSAQSPGWSDVAL
jgi:UDP-4-amino-4-deoxy-L-arabinose formyltransferase/UDP-glucuronic acid dehydrogenase (UDP-4-keto-hexauronic acid decarboxylating)